jgi:hypothetical protein
MTNFRLNFRNVIAIVICLAGITIFAACDKTNGNDDNGGGEENNPIGKIDPDLTGRWGYGVTSTFDWHNYNTGNYEYTSGRIEGFEFKSNATFSCFVILIGKTTIVITEHKGNYSMGDKTLDPGGSGLEGKILYLTKVMVKETVYVNKIINKNETFDWKSMQSHNLVVGFLNPPDKNTIWFIPYQFEYGGSSDYRINLSGLDRIVD